MHNRGGYQRPQGATASRQSFDRPQRASRNGEDIAELLRPPPQAVDYFERGSNDRTIRVALLDDEARALAEELAALPSTQLRRFFEPVVALRQRVLAKSIDDAGIQAELALLKARAAYAHGRSGAKVPTALVRFFTRHAHSVRDQAQFLAFSRHFEAVVAYHRAFNPS